MALVTHHPELHVSYCPREAGCTPDHSCPHLRALHSGSARLR